MATKLGYLEFTFPKVLNFREGPARFGAKNSRPCTEVATSNAGSAFCKQTDKI